MEFMLHLSLTVTYFTDLYVYISLLINIESFTISHVTREQTTI